jgi:O-antigen/teichoic acid export membrane protein
VSVPGGLDPGAASPIDPLEEPFYRSGDWWRRTGSAGAAYLGATSLALATSVVAARALGPANYGTVVLATSVVATIAAFLDLSLEEAVVHYGARALTAGDIGALRGLLLVSLRLDAVVGLAVFVALVATAGPVAGLVGHNALRPLLLRIAAVEALAATLNGTTGAALMLAGRPQLRAWSMAWGNLARLVAVTVAVRVLHDGAQGLLWGYVIGAGVGALVQGALASTVARAKWFGVATAPPPATARQLAWFGLHSSTATTVVAARTGIVAVAVGRVAGPEALGLLSVAMFPVTLAAVVTAPLRLTTFAEQARMAAEGRLRTLWRAIRGYSLISLGVGLAAAAIGWFILPSLLPALYSHSFESALDPARILLVAAVATLATAWAKALPAAVGRPAVRTVVTVGEVVLLAILMVAFGAAGAVEAATALSITAVVVSVTWLVVARRMLVGAGEAT